MKKGSCHLEKSKNKISEANKNCIPWNRGLTKDTDERMKKMSESLMGKNTWIKGSSFSGKHKENMSKAYKERHTRTEFKKGHPYYPGKIGKKGQNLKGSNHPAWKGGVSTETNKRVNDANWVTLRKRIYERDHWQCQICGKHCREDIQCHHIIPVRENGSDEMSNLTTLSRSCHRRSEFGKNAEFWKVYLSMHIPININ